MCLQGEVGDNNAARSVLPDAAVTTALVDSFSVYPARHPSDLVLLLLQKGSGISFPCCGKSVPSEKQTHSSKVC